MPRSINIGVENPTLKGDYDIKSATDLLLTEILKKTAQQYGLSVRELRSSTRSKDVVRARVEFCREIRKDYPKITLVSIGDALNRDHSTVSHYLTNYTE